MLKIKIRPANPFSKYTNDKYFVYRDKNNINLVSITDGHANYLNLEQLPKGKDLFTSIITGFSQESDYEKAKSQWQICNVKINNDDRSNSTTISDMVEKTYCICGRPIKELITIVNINNGTEIRVGSTCQDEFMADKLAGILFRNYKQLITNYSDCGLNHKMLEIAQYNNIITEQEAKFYLEITTGKGARNHYDPKNTKFSIKKWIIRACINGKILINLQQQQRNDFGGNEVPTCTCQLPNNISEDTQQDNTEYNQSNTEYNEQGLPPQMTLKRQPMKLFHMRTETIITKLRQQNHCYPFFYACASHECKTTLSLNEEDFILRYPHN